MDETYEPDYYSYGKLTVTELLAWQKFIRAAEDTAAKFAPPHEWTWREAMHNA